MSDEYIVDNGWKRAGKIGGAILVFVTILSMVGNPILGALGITTQAEISELSAQYEATHTELRSAIVSVDTINDQRYHRIERMLDCMMRAPIDMRPIDFCRGLQRRTDAQ